ncbi:hypothetical protein KDJ21_007205 [Metabacillus litoralis]|uniref:hypothetical protein n=1 Tax=Metabacillus TaxID=2675233 RepID=UPI001B92896A|nr:hypothetical protein [Metabacillus litoralis]UHA61437.1 hypothetical protein KDJ21_007205 [Metabacillus litoralis]
MANYREENMNLKNGMLIVVVIMILSACNQEDAASSYDISEQSYEESSNSYDSVSEIDESLSEGYNESGEDYSADESFPNQEAISDDMNGITFDELRDAVVNQNSVHTSDPQEYISKFNACLNIYEDAFKSVPDVNNEEINFEQLSENFDHFQRAVECYQNDVPYYDSGDELLDLIVTYVDMQNKVVNYISWGRRIQDKMAAGEDYRLNWNIL